MLLTYSLSIYRLANQSDGEEVEESADDANGRSTPVDTICSVESESIEDVSLTNLGERRE